MLHIIKKVEDWFIGELLHETQDPVDHTRIKMIYRASSAIALVALLFLVPNTLQLSDSKLLLSVTFTGIIIIAFIPFILKYSKSYQLAAKVFLIAIFTCVSFAHYLVTIPDILSNGLWYTIVAIVAGFIINKKWSLGFILMAIFNVTCVAALNFYNFETSFENSYEVIYHNPKILLSLPITVAIPFLVIYYLMVEHVKIRDEMNNHVMNLLSEQNELNKKLEEREMLYRQLIEGADDMIYEFNSEGYFTYINPALEKITGYSIKNGEKIAYNEPIPKAYKIEQQAFYQKQIKEKKQVTYNEFPVKTKDGNIIWMGQKANMFFDENGKMTRVLCIGRDISMQKQTEENLIRAKEQAVKASLVKAQFLSSMSHEIRTPMNAVIGLIHLLLQENPSKHQKEHLNTLKFSAENLLALINDILDFSKIEAGKIEFHNTDFNLKQIAKNIHHGFGSKALEKGIGLALNYHELLPEMVIGDTLRFSQILNNLVNNAIKFTDEGGVTVDLLLHKEHEDSIDVYCSVKDTGIGIPNAKLKTIFDDFTQVTDDTIRQGTGLGLAITKELLSLQGSEIKVRSKIGEGSDFYFILNFKRSQKIATKENNENRFRVNIENQKDSMKGINLLLVEDNLINQKVTINFLSKWGLSVDIADNGQIAVDMVQQKNYDIILMDLQMPVMNGIDATKTIRKMGGQFKKVPIIALTASAVLEIKDNAMQAGLNDFITKPFLPDDLYEKIAQYTAYQREQRLKEAMLN